MLRSLPCLTPSLSRMQGSWPKLPRRRREAPTGGQSRGCWDASLRLVGRGVRTRDEQVSVDAGSNQPKGHALCGDNATGRENTARPRGGASTVRNVKGRWWGAVIGCYSSA
eukprot:scaffold1883_cov396-Prasinococcus_capsulatus_cf.AAC.16